MVCVDTSFLIALERHEASALEKMSELADSGETIYTTAVNVAEYYRGAYGARDREKALRDAQGLLGLFAVLSMDYESGKKWGELSEFTKSSSIGDRDLFVACIALVNRQPILTRNRKHFESVPGLLVESW